MISKDICINTDLLLDFEFKMRYKLKNESCFSKKNVVVYLYSDYIVVLVRLCDHFDHELFKLNQLKEFIQYVKKSL